MAYTVSFSREAEKFLDRTEKDLYARISDEIQSLAINPRPNGAIKIKSNGRYRVRVGDYRIIYEIKDKELLVMIVHIYPRDKAYK